MSNLDYYGYKKYAKASYLVRYDIYVNGKECLNHV